MSDNEQQTPRPLSDRMKSVGRRGVNELTRKGGISEQVGGMFKRWARSVWEVRGGGFYALGFIVAFTYLEVMELLFDDIPKLISMRDPLGGELLSFIIDFFVDTLINLLLAFIWPLYVLQWQAPWGLLLLVAGFFLFPKFLKAPLENWLFDGAQPNFKKKRSKCKRRKEKA